MDNKTIGKDIFAICIAALITAVFFAGMIKGIDMTEQECPKDQRLDLLSAKVQFRSGGRYWVNPYTVEIEEMPEYTKP